MAEFNIGDKLTLKQYRRDSTDEWEVRDILTHYEGSIHRIKYSSPIYDLKGITYPGRSMNISEERLMKIVVRTDIKEAEDGSG